MTRQLLLIFSLVALACEEVIDLEPSGEEPRLIIDALLRAENNGTFQLWETKVTLTDGFFGEVPVTQLEQISLVRNPSEGEPAIFTEDDVGSGIYVEGTLGAPIDPDTMLIFQVSHESGNYLATGNFMASIPYEVTYLGQSDGVDRIQVTFEDDPNKDNFYLFDFGMGEFFTTDDEFYNGQVHSFEYSFVRSLPEGSEQEIFLLGSDEQLNNYMDQLIDQNQKEFGPFETPVGTVRGNFINVTNIDNINSFDNVGDPDNFALGYFAIVEEVKRTFLVE